MVRSHRPELMVIEEISKEEALAYAAEHKIVIAAQSFKNFVNEYEQEILIAARITKGDTQGLPDYVHITSVGRSSLGREEFTTKMTIREAEELHAALEEVLETLHHI